MNMVVALYDPLQQGGDIHWKEGIECHLCSDFESFLAAEAALYLYWASSDQLLLHQSQLEGIEKPLLVASVSITLEELGWAQHPQRARFNGWPGMRKGQCWEWSGAPLFLQYLQDTLGFQGLSVPDQVGFLAPRVVAMIINEACYALAEGVSTEADINTAMRFGTNYPYGPFEWTRLIGWKEVHALLKALARTDAKYEPHPGMQTFLNA